MGTELVTREHYERMDAFNKGYAIYVQSELPGSELKGLTNPYPTSDFDNYMSFLRGQFEAMIWAQDSEE